MPSPVPPDTTARLTALAEMASGHAEAAARRAEAAGGLQQALRTSALTGCESVRRAAGRALAGVHREAARAEGYAAETVTAMIRLRAGREDAGEVGRLVAHGVRKSSRAAASATGALGRAARLVAGLAAWAGSQPGAAALWAGAWPVLRSVELTEVPTGRLRLPRTRVDAEAEVAGVVAHLQALAPAFLVLEVAGTAGRYVQAYADEQGVRVESVSNRSLERPHRLTHAEAAAVAAAGLAAPDDESPNWYLDLPAAPPSVAAGLLVRLLAILDPGLRQGFRIRTVADERDEPKTAGCAPVHGAPTGGEPEPGTVVEGIAGPMLVVEAHAPDVVSLAMALCDVVYPWVEALGWAGVVVVVDQIGCAFAVEVAPTAGIPVARLLPYVAAPPDVEATLTELGWELANEDGQPWWRRLFPSGCPAVVLLDAVVDTLHTVCGLELGRCVLLQVAPA